MTRDYILTYTGKKFRPLNPDPADICIEDIAHALSNTCRYTGHTSVFYSVAEHSVLVADRVLALATNHPFKESIGLAGLLHDASEAYLTDIATPLKVTDVFAEYRKAEARLQYLINETFHLQGGAHHLPEVKQADFEVFTAEAALFMKQVDGVWPPEVDLGSRRPWGLNPASAKMMFLRRFRELEQCTR